MWKRNLAMIGLLAAGGVLFAGSLLENPEPSHWDAGAAGVTRQPDFRATVERVDAALRQRWSELGIEPAPPAPDLAVIRRASLALTGTVPSLEEIRMLQDRQPREAVAWWISGLLRDRRSSDYLAERLARAFVGTKDGPFLIYRRRRFVSWLADQLHGNRPYDELVRDLIADDGLWTSQPSTNFLTVTVKQGSAGPDEAELAARVFRGFLGVRVDCAQCHDHPFDRWTQEDFHNLAAFFGRTEVSFTGIREGKHEYTWTHHASGEERTGGAAVPFQPELLPAGRNNRRRLARWVTHPENKAFSRAAVNRVWAILFGRALVEPVDNLPVEGEVHPVLEILAEDFASHGFDLRRLIQLIAASEAFHLDSVEPDGLDDDQLDLAVQQWAVFPMTRLRPEQVVGALLQACSVQTIDYDSNILVRIARATGQSQFVNRYGDAGEDELLPHGGTIPQRLLLLNGNLVTEKTNKNVLANAASQVAAIAPDDAAAVDCAYLSVFARPPTAAERERFAERLRGTHGDARMRVMQDIYATLLNATEFSWNH